MFFGISQIYTIDIYGFYFEEYMLGYLVAHLMTLNVLSLGELPAVFIQRHVGRRSRIITMGQSPYGDFNDIIQLVQDVIFDSKSLVSDHKDGSTFK